MITAIAFSYLIWVQPGDRIEMVRSGQLDIRPGMEIGPVFEKYRWWVEYRWEVEDGSVLFRGTFSEHQANLSFREIHQYQLKLGFKYSRLSNFYGINASPEATDQIVIRFDFEGEEFRVASGTFSRKPTAEQPWHHTPMSDKALLQMIKAFYHQQDPFFALIKGLPYK